MPSGDHPHRIPSFCLGARADTLRKRDEPILFVACAQRMCMNETVDLESASFCVESFTDPTNRVLNQCHVDIQASRICIVKLVGTLTARKADVFILLAFVRLSE
jgi:hypothetical protein